MLKGRHVFADTANMTSMVVYFITSERKTPKNMTKCGGIGMSQTSMQRSTPVERATGVAEVEDDEWTR